MSARVHIHERLVFPVGTQVVVLRDVLATNGRVLQPRGSVGVVVRAPVDLDHAYWVRFPDGVEEALFAGELMILAQYKEGPIGDVRASTVRGNLYDRVIYRCIIGSRAYGLDSEHSDTDRRGIFLPPADLHWSLYGVPEQLECEAAQEAYWELQKFLVLALRRTPTCWNVSILRWWRRRLRWPKSCCRCAQCFSPAWSITRTTAT